MFTVGQAAQTRETMTVGSTSPTMALVRCPAAAQPVRRPRREHEESRAAAEPATLFRRSRWVLIASGKRHERQDGLAIFSAGRRRRPIIAA
jgi:hypothetical protein